MHQQSLDVFRELFNKIPDLDLAILDVGSLDVNGTYHSVFTSNVKSYIGIDLQAGPNVDIVLDDPYKFPFKDGQFDLVISNQTLEHSEFFWLVLAEMVRVTKKWIIITVPSAGAIHQYPVDCYRFLPDSFRGWARYFNLELVDLIHKINDEWQWKDLGGVFKK